MEKTLRWLLMSSRKKGGTDKIGLAKTKLTTSRHFSLLGFLHSVVSSQNTDSNVEINFVKTKLTAKRQLKHLRFVLFQRKTQIKDQMFPHIKIQEKEELEKLLISSLWNP